MRQQKINFFFISSRMEESDESKINRSFSLQKQKKIGENGRWEQFVRNSRHIMEPQLKSGY